MLTNFYFIIPVIKIRHVFIMGAIERKKLNSYMCTLSLIHVLYRHNQLQGQ